MDLTINKGKRMSLNKPRYRNEVLGILMVLEAISVMEEKDVYHHSVAKVLSLQLKEFSSSLTTKLEKI